MKKILFPLACILCLTAKAQNPDGQNASLHITPSWLWGNATFTRHTSVWLPDAMSYPAQYTTDRYTGMLKYQPAFGISAMVKIPAASFLTMNVSYAFQQRFEEETDYLHYWGLNGNIHKVDLTLSVYNLFSIYQE